MGYLISMTHNIISRNLSSLGNKHMRKIKLILVLSFLVLLQGCNLVREDYNKITPNNFYKTEKDARLAVAALYNNSITKVGTWSSGLFVQNINSVQLISDIAAGDMIMNSYGDNPWEYLRNHEWTESNGYGTDNFFHYYSDISEARIVAKKIKKMDTIPGEVKDKLLAEAYAIAGWKAAILYNLYGSVPYPTDEMLENPADIKYPERPSNEEFVKIIESFFAKKDDLMAPDFGANFGRMNKGIANFVLMRLYMLEAARTENDDYWNRAKKRAEEIIATVNYEI